jgi:hypothetical protein
VLSTDPLLQRPGRRVTRALFDGLRLMFPDLKMEEIEGAHLNRAVKVQPLQVLNLQHRAKVVTAHPDFSF